MPALEHHARLVFSLCTRGSSPPSKDKGLLMGLQPAQVQYIFVLYLGRCLAWPYVAMTWLL